MEKTFELKCPNCNVMLHTSLELKVSQGVDTTSFEVYEEAKRYAELLFRIPEKEFDSVDFKEYCSKLGVSLLKKNMDEVLETLTPREEKFIKMRFGIGNIGLEHTLEEVGQHFSITGGRIWQIEDKALKKLRHPSRLRKLDEVLKQGDINELDEFSLAVGGFTLPALPNES